MRVFWRRLLVRLGILKLYRIDYGEQDWVSAYSEEQALTWWRNFQCETAGPEWLEEIDLTDGVEASRERALETVVGGDDVPRGFTFRDAMVESAAPAFVASTCF